MSYQQQRAINELRYALGQAYDALAKVHIHLDLAARAAAALNCADRPAFPPLHTDTGRALIAISHVLDRTHAIDGSS